MRVLLWSLLLAALATLPAGAAEKSALVMGDYNAELRAGEHVDIPLMVKRLTELGANTYMWLIWHHANDWEDLQQFLPEALKALYREFAAADR